MWRGVRSGANGRLEDGVDEAVYQGFVRCNDGLALEVEVVVQAVENEVHDVRGNAVHKLDNLVRGLAALLESDWE